MILTTGEASAILDTTEHAIRMLVYRKHLTPITPGTHPLTFHAADVYDLQVRRRTPAQRRADTALWQQVDDVLAAQVSGM